MVHTIQPHMVMRKLVVVSLASAGLLTQSVPVVMADDNSANVAVSSLNTDKSRYSPNEPVTLQAHIQNTNQTESHGTYTITVANPLASSQSDYGYTQTVGTGHYDVSGKDSMDVRAVWTADQEDYRGYIATIKLTDDAGQVVSFNATGIDVSSNWTKFPRYAVMSNFTNASQTSDDNVNLDAETLNKYHVNASMYYDAYYRPQNPFPTDQFKNWIGDDINTQLIRTAIANQHQYGQATLLYDMINATTGVPSDNDANMSNSWLFQTKTKADGTTLVSSPAGIFRTTRKTLTSDEGFGKANTFDVKGEQQTFNMLGTYNDRADADHKIQSYYNPYSKDWQQYIGPTVRTALDKLGFDGWQGDTIGDQEKVVSYENRGTTTGAFDVSAGYGDFANAMKSGAMKDKAFGINAVGGQGQRGLDKSQVDFQYNEIWPWDWDDNTAPGNTNSAHDTYSALSRVVDNTMQQAHKSLIASAYMYRNWANSGKAPAHKTFNDNAILLKDASIFSAGGDSLELTDNGRQLFTEYYPDSRKDKTITMSDTLGNADTGKLRKMYDFVTAYENFLRGGNLQRTKNRVEIWTGSAVGDGQNLAVKNESVPGTIMATTKSGHNGTIDDAETINLINFRDVTDTHWQVDNANEESQKNIKEQKDLWVKYYPDDGRTVHDVFVSSPDAKYQSTNQKLDFTSHVDEQGQTYLTFKLPSLEVWDLIYMK